MYRVQYVIEKPFVWSCASPYKLIWEETVEVLPQAGDELIRSNETENTFVDGIVQQVELSLFDWIENLQSYPQYVAVVSTKTCIVRGKNIR